jgi:hypothetical protein
LPRLNAEAFRLAMTKVSVASLLAMTAGDCHCEPPVREAWQSRSPTLLGWRMCWRKPIS